MLGGSFLCVSLICLVSRRGLSLFTSLSRAPPVVIISAPSLWLPDTFIWRYPARWLRLVKPFALNPCFAMSTVAHALKLWQGLIVLLVADWSALDSQPWWVLLLIAALVGFGQHLNFLVYYRLGHDGVYYGSRFGKPAEWVTGYPYNTFRDPQYLGALLTLAAIGFVIPLHFSLLWIANYLYLIYLESSVPSPPAELASKETSKKE